MTHKTSDVKIVENGNDLSKVLEDKVGLKVTRSIITLLCHVMVGVIVSVSFLYAYRNSLPLTVTMKHIQLCVVGYQLLMIEAILAMAPDSWLSSLKLKHRRLIHWVMQILGSILAIAGSFLKMLDKDVHWNTLHGKFALAAMVFTSVSLVNGLASLYAYEWRRVLPGFMSKLTHICFGIAAIFCANICLMYGFNKLGFREWATSRMADTIIIMTSILTVIIIINPFLTFYKRFRGAINV